MFSKVTIKVTVERDFKTENQVGHIILVRKKFWVVVWIVWNLLLFRRKPIRHLTLIPHLWNNIASKTVARYWRIWRNIMVICLGHGEKLPYVFTKPKDLWISGEMNHTVWHLLVTWACANLYGDHSSFTQMGRSTEQEVLAQLLSINLKSLTSVLRDAFLHNSSTLAQFLGEHPCYAGAA